MTKTNGSATRAGMVALVTVLGARVVRQYPTPEDDADDE